MCEEFTLCAFTVHRYLKCRNCSAVAFSLFCYSGHGLHCLKRIFTTCCLTTQHQSIRIGIYRIGYIRHLRTCRTRIVYHCMKHLCCHNNRFFLHDTFVYNASLNTRYSFDRDFNAKIATRNHNTIRSVDNLIYIIHTLLILDFRDDFYITSVFVKYLLYSKNVICRSYKRVCDEIDIQFYGQQYIFIITFGYRRQIYMLTRYVYALMCSQHTIVLNLRNQHRTDILNNLHIDLTVIKKHIITNFHILSNVYITDIYYIMRGIHIWTSENLHYIPNLILYGFFYVRGTNLRSFCIYHQCYMR